MNVLQPKLRFPEFEGEWKKKKLKEIGTFLGGGTPSTKKIEFWNGNIPWISSSDISEDNIFDIRKTRFITSQAVNESATKIVPKNSILIVSRVGVGKVAVSNADLCTSQDFTNINLFDSDHIFVAYLIKNETKKLIEFNQGTSIKGFVKSDLEDLVVVMPLKSEQTKIANFLSSIDEKINLLKEKKALLEEYKKGMMQKIFNQEIRFKDDNGNDFEEWEEKTLGEVSSKESSNISANKIEDNFGEFIIYGASGVLKKVNFYLQENDYISIIKDGAGVGRIFYCEGKSSVLGTMEMIKPIEGINTYFLYCLLNNIDFSKFITGSTIPHIYYKDYSKVICGIPCLKEQTKIANFLSAIDEKITLVATQIEDTQEYKKGLLQQMFV